MFFELAKGSFNLWPELEELVLPPGHRPDLFWPGRRDDHAPEVSPDMPSGDFGGVAGIGYDDSRRGVDEMLELENVSLIGTGEPNSRKSAVVVNARMQLKAVVPTLPVLAECGDSSRYFVSVGTNVPTDWQHGGIGKTERRSRRERTGQELYEQREDSVAMCYEVLVLWELWKAVLVVSCYPVVH